MLGGGGGGGHHQNRKKPVSKFISRLPRVCQNVPVLRHDADADFVGAALDPEADVHGALNRGFRWGRKKEKKNSRRRIVSGVVDDDDEGCRNSSFKHKTAFACKAKSLFLSRSLPFSLSLSSHQQNFNNDNLRMEGRSRRERAPKRGAAALAALARLRGGDDDGAAAAAASAGAAATASGPSRRRRQLDDFEVKDADAVYDVVDEDEYADLVAKRRREGGEILN